MARYTSVMDKTMQSPWAMALDADDRAKLADLLEERARHRALANEVSARIKTLRERGAKRAERAKD